MRMNESMLHTRKNSREYANLSWYASGFSTTSIWDVPGIGGKQLSLAEIRFVKSSSRSLSSGRSPRSINGSVNENKKKRDRSLVPLGG